ncbi:NADH dehydrogenase [ubiquinone] 1 beta subcomplex subunit 7 isoform X1 [Acyrthosiphon pisum]|uniref:NADH dehydrogenase [ubiquinone] 1 beta subcomplex subunit 7 n=1 Tax=Acyrthosiphon pisum TaxID=7029 RepID=A0A8R2HAI4_ACYPI|nr:NADH dehydrogenase [ubiquinone] 1 beta subcomplex subunit 7 isoform X1 [Acyrthosiphon pisum]XP_008187502.1 NADH dehydrogenase [ubiquinone] 1 beta subcomplex subunit 7 isoform X1 [Acyrthosiphon pisum]XP_008187503.1 NADH dehydrogenase [ubiquinone] 1 beta subcomplex subunit 7 isoform X1 [Acyrthosiphon pisum]XP_016663511.1 NADH dehydrogenase [ubiquinone] 1 beta subcomplex subunit 7 isoform X1 [Acyrthosiphon pisum]|eukprot:XP_008187501.1 PREDICTED: NADH dehydrogenase [ubiquinone] 1 beta subcomplex subunit 7 isoform X1 [Acyrthosiphon pisum]
MGHTWSEYVAPETTPLRDKPSQFEPHFGFSTERREKKMIASLAEMESAKVPLDARDFCAHMLLNLRGCIRDNFPFNHHCHHEREEYYECQYHDYLDRMKDYEREKRLLHRRHQLRQGGAPNAEEGTISA